MRWAPVSQGLLGAVSALAIHDQGQGPELYAAGFLGIAGQADFAAMAKWNGSDWVLLGGEPNSSVASMAVFDSGTGQAIHVGGDFADIGGVAIRRLAQWTGSTWSTVGSSASVSDQSAP